MNSATNNSTFSTVSYGPQVKFYGTQAAICFQASELKDRIPSINIELTGIVDGKSQWQVPGRKLGFQLTESELPIFCGLLLGFLPHMKIKRGNKGVEMRRQKRDDNNLPGLYVYASAGSDKQYRLLLPVGLMAKTCVLASSQFIKDLGADMSVASPAIRSACALLV